MLSVRLRSDRRPGSEVGSELPAFFDVPEGSRLALVQAVGARVIKNMPGDLLQSIYRLDVTPIDHANRTLRVVVEARSRNETEHGPWTFDLTFPKSPSHKRQGAPWPRENKAVADPTSVRFLRVGTGSRRELGVPNGLAAREAIVKRDG